MKNIKALITIIRPLNCLITFFTIITACFICADSFDYKIILIAAFAGAFVNACGNIINDYFDMEIDKINRPNRVLPSGKISPRLALNSYVSITYFAILLAFYNLNFNAFLIVLITSAMMFLYSFILKGIPLVGNIVVAFFTGLAFLFGSVVVGNIYCGIIPTVFAFLISLMRELVKDVEDIKGDQSVSISTFPIKYGVDSTVKLISILGIVLIISTTIPFLFKIYNLYYFIFVSLFVNGIIVYVISRLRKDTSQITLSTTSVLLKVGMVMGVISILIGTKL
ncbi:MAG: geranylgeranylglycerol-phosphate geranylgeranyltransferase [Bacteroidetes bacterium]|nr:geranylgeranylglycerol-phosphate geranylgeranyltransferase [Bacteroidota bacterium]MBU1117170.1 geranylgeranylglycerol-phosphate geranylgeranyltransferase [Bacteroidota bacterium]MBU1798558.1 geranylgeranylglycerol-phosphate geranylgeranyltransferase [Bacteroidota bacterium]